ncbi:MBL fold metallo-hydrolase RNA specificity domain-containing protein [Vibrio hangzhouensis]|uniref:Metallo-beta-lactamase family protein n=1 Tax=Vibrio hangzhouensis TaxID=462991 RepID=A0A1H6C1A4_9VIBR|nr:MBL fold metallo-hydrolase [Vibrio hangzhouensis]SEG66156.1 metallo-beta-lactamase family protein [Vibrio hangzhouensis]
MQLTHNVEVFHHGGKRTVTGSCHELRIGEESILIDCGLYQGSDEKQHDLALPFNLQRIQGIVLTHAHIDHIGRIPWLMAAGYRGPIYCTPATAYLVPLMLSDALKLQSGLSGAQIDICIELVSKHLRPIAYSTWVPIKSCRNDYFSYVRLNPAGHILGSAYAEFKLPNNEIAVFSGDLGPSQTPLLPDPVSPQRADYLFLESTYGDKQHESIDQRSERLLTIINRSLRDGGAIVVPAFSVGRTQELLFDIESLLHQHKLTSRLPIIIDSPMAAKVTKAYRRYRKLWAQEAQHKLQQGRRPLDFSQCIVVESHREHKRIVNRLASTGEAAIVVSASGMCQGGRVMEYLKALLPDKRTDILFCGYQAEGTLGRDIQQGKDEVWIDGKTIKINASVHSISGYSAHADRSDLIKFVEGCQPHLKQLHLIHGEDSARQNLAAQLKVLYPSCDVVA